MKKYLGVLRAQLKNLFPNIKENPDANYDNCRRVVLFLFDQLKKTFEIRNYFIKKTFTGLNKGIKKLLNNEKIMDFSKVGDVSELFLADKAEISDSDVDNLQTKLSVEQKSQGNTLKTEISIRLYEIGPRVSMKLIKIEEDFLKGEVLYHGLIKKSLEDQQKTRDKIDQMQKLKIKRREEQEVNVNRKLLAKRSQKTFMEDQEEEKSDSEEKKNLEDEELIDHLENDFV